MKNDCHARSSTDSVPVVHVIDHFRNVPVLILFGTGGNWAGADTVLLLSPVKMTPPGIVRSPVGGPPECPTNANSRTGRVRKNRLGWLWARQGYRGLIIGAGLRMGFLSFRFLGGVVITSLVMYFFFFSSSNRLAQ